MTSNQTQLTVVSCSYCYFVYRGNEYAMTFTSEIALNNTLAAVYLSTGQKPIHIDPKFVDKQFGLTREEVEDLNLNDLLNVFRKTNHVIKIDGVIEKDSEEVSENASRSHPILANITENHYTLIEGYVYKGNKRVDIFYSLSHEDIEIYKRGIIVTGGKVTELMIRELKDCNLFNEDNWPLELNVIFDQAEARNYAVVSVD